MTQFQRGRAPHGHLRGDVRTLSALSFSGRKRGNPRNSGIPSPKIRNSSVNLSRIAIWGCYCDPMRIASRNLNLFSAPKVVRTGWCGSQTFIKTTVSDPECFCSMYHFLMEVRAKSESSNSAFGRLPCGSNTGVLLAEKLKGFVNE